MHAYLDGVKDLCTVQYNTIVLHSNMRPPVSAALDRETLQAGLPGGVVE